LTLTTCSIKNFFPRHWLLAYVTKISRLKCERRQSHICFRLIGYDTKQKCMRHTHDTTFSENILDFYKILEESEQFFLLFLKKMENLRRFFSIF
jgi:hypothetical protein